MLSRLIIWDFVGTIWSKIENGGDGIVLQQESKMQKNVRPSWCFQTCRNQTSIMHIRRFVCLTFHLLKIVIHGG
jgi:hypothetical protein